MNFQGISRPNAISISQMEEAEALAEQCCRILREKPVGARSPAEVDCLVKFTESLAIFSSTMEAGGEQHRELCQIFVYLEAAQDERVIRQGEAGDTLFIILKGNVRFEISMKEKIVNVGRRGAGEVFGEVAILTSDPRAASAYADLGPCQLISVHRDDYRGALDKVHKREVDNRIHFLKKIHIFRGWTVERLEDFAKCLASSAHSAGSVIMVQGETPTNMYFVRGGRVRHLFRLQNTTVTLEIATMGKWEYFGERGLVVPGSKNYGSVVADTDVEILALSSHDFLRKFTMTAVQEMQARMSQYATFDEMMIQFTDELRWGKYKSDLTSDILQRKKWRTNGLAFPKLKRSISPIRRIKGAEDDEFHFPIDLETRRLMKKKKRVLETTPTSPIENTALAAASTASVEDHSTAGAAEVEASNMLEGSASGTSVIEGAALPGASSVIKGSRGKKAPSIMTAYDDGEVDAIISARAEARFDSDEGTELVMPSAAGRDVSASLASSVPSVVGKEHSLSIVVKKPSNKNQHKASTRKRAHKLKPMKSSETRVVEIPFSKKRDVLEEYLPPSPAREHARMTTQQRIESYSEKGKSWYHIKQKEQASLARII